MIRAAISPAANIDIIINSIKGKETEGESKHVLKYAAAAPALNIIDNYFEREGEKE